MTRRRFISIIEPGLGWLLKDDFIDLRAAGSVDGTPATPGPGIREVVTDTNNKLSVGSGVLDVAAGAAAHDGVWYNAISQVIGRLVVAKATLEDEIGLDFGFDTNQTTSITKGIIFSGSGLFIGGSYRTSVLAANTPYYLAIVISLSAFYSFIKGGVFSNWTLVNTTGLSAVSPYPALRISSASRRITVDFLRVPLQTWLPTPLAYDTFTRANGAIGSTEAVGPDSQQVSAKAWTSNLGTTQIASNKLSTSALSGGKAIATIEGDNAEVLASIDLVRGSATGGLTFNYADASNYCYAEHDGTNYTVVKVVATTPTTLIDTAATYSSGAACQIHTYISGGALKVRAYYNNALIGTEQSISDAALIAATKHGWYATDTDSTGDNFTLFARGQNDASYDFLNRFIK